jgi:hypothetical protein
MFWCLIECSGRIMVQWKIGLDYRLTLGAGRIPSEAQDSVSGMSLPRLVGHGGPTE